MSVSILPSEDFTLEVRTMLGGVIGGTLDTGGVVYATTGNQIKTLEAYFSFKEATHRLGVGTNAVNAALTIRGDSGAPGTGVTPATGTIGHFIGNDTSSFDTKVLVDAVQGIPAISGRRSQGTFASPTATTNASSVLDIEGYGYGASQYVGPSARIRFKAEEQYTNTVFGTSISLWTTGVGSGTLTQRMEIGAGGSVGIGATSSTDQLVKLAKSVAATGQTESVLSSTLTATAGDGSYERNGIISNLTLSNSSGTIVTAKAINAITSVTSATGRVSSLVGVGVGTSVASGAEVTDLRMFNVEPVSVTAGSVPNFYGLYIGTISGPTNTWAIYSSSNIQSYLRGNLGINAASPSKKLHIIDAPGDDGILLETLSSGNAPFITWKVNDSNPKYSIRHVGGATGTARLAFGAGDADSGFTEQVSFLTNGKVGLATTSPNTTIDCNGDVAHRQGGQITLSNGDNEDVSIGAFSAYGTTGPTATFGIGGFTNGFNGKNLSIFNATSYVMSIKDESASSSAANRIRTGTLTRVYIQPGQAASFYYDYSLSRWLMWNGTTHPMFLFTQTSDSTTTANSLTTLFGSGIGSLTIPANFMTAGRKLRIRISGYVSTGDGGAGTKTLTLYFGGTTVANGTSNATFQLPTNTGFQCQAELTCRSVGTLGVIAGSAYLSSQITASSGTNSVFSFYSGGGTSNTTISNTIDIRYNNGNATGVLTTQQASLEVLN